MLDSMSINLTDIRKDLRLLRSNFIITPEELCLFDGVITSAVTNILYIQKYLFRKINEEINGSLEEE